MQYAIVASIFFESFIARTESGFCLPLLSANGEHYDSHLVYGIIFIQNRYEECIRNILDKKTACVSLQRKFFYRDNYYNHVFKIIKIIIIILCIKVWLSAFWVKNLFCSDNYYNRVLKIIKVIILCVKNYLQSEWEMSLRSNNCYSHVLKIIKIMILYVQ